MKLNIHSVTRLLGIEEQHEKRVQAKIDQRRQARLARQAVVQRAALLADRISEAERQFARSIAPVDNAVSFDPSGIYRLWLTRNGGEAAGMPIEDLARMLAEFEAMKIHSERLKRFVRDNTVAVAQKALADYKSKNAEILKGIELVPSDEPEFVHQVLPADHYLSGASSALVRAATSPT